LISYKIFINHESFLIKKLLSNNILFSTQNQVKKEKKQKKNPTNVQTFQNNKKIKFFFLKKKTRTLLSCMPEVSNELKRLLSSHKSLKN